MSVSLVFILSISVLISAKNSNEKWALSLRIMIKLGKYFNSILLNPETCIQNKNNGMLGITSQWKGMGFEFTENWLNSSSSFSLKVDQ